MFNVTTIITLLILSVVNLNTDEHLSPKEKQYLKEYAFCSCFRYATDDPDYFAKRDISLSVFREFAAGQPDELFFKIDSLAKIAANNIKPSTIADHEGQKAVLKWCLTFYESNELKSLIDSYQNK